MFCKLKISYFFNDIFLEIELIGIVKFLMGEVVF